MRILFLLSCLLVITSVQAQRYAYVRDNDMYTNLREAPNLNSKIIDTIYNLQVIQLFDENKANEWWKVLLSNKSGYIHESRLVFLPEKYTMSIDSIWSWHNRNMFIVSTDSPEIIANWELQNIRIEYDTDKTGNFCNRILSSPSYAVITNHETGKELESFNEISPIQITVYPSKLHFSTNDFMYSYYRNQKNKTCRGLTFINKKDILKTTAQEQEALLTIAQEIFEATKHLDWEKTNEYHLIISIFDKYLGVNNFDYLEKLEQLYLREHTDALKLYPYLLHRFSLDGDGTHTIEDYQTRRWAFENRGEIEI